MDEKFQIPTTNGDRFDGLLYRPTRTPAPGLVMVPEIFGVNRALRETARRYADQGYVVLLMDIFWRLDRNVDLEYDKEGYDRAWAYHRAFDYELGVVDLQAAIDQLRERPECSGSVGVVGFCLGGTMAYLAASRCSSDASVGYYATRIQNFLDDGPTIARPLILHFGERDHTTPPEIMERILPAVAGNKNISSHIYEGVGHAFANHTRPTTYNESATRLADGRTFEFFQRWLTKSVSTRAQ